MTKLAASNASTQAVVADTNGIILELICKGIVALGHGANEDANAFFGRQVGDVIAHADHGSVKTQRDFAAVGWQMIGDGVLDDPQKLFLRCC